jgi:hypothetical protein
MPTKISPVGKKKCRPFVLQVSVMNPEADFKFELMVEKKCSPELDPIWKLVFDLFKKNTKGEFIQIIHVSYTAETAEESAGISATSVNGLTPKQAEVAIKEVHPGARKIGEGTGTAADEKKVIQGMRKIAVLGN